MAQAIPLESTRHGDLSVRAAPDFETTVGQQVLPITVFEFGQAGNDCPVVFVKNAETGQFQSVMLLGLAQGENLMYQDGQWQAMYVPAVLRLAPFRLLMSSPDADTSAMGIDMESPLVGEGERLFTESGEPTDYLNQRREALERYFQQGQVTQVFQSLLVEHDLLSAQSLTMNIGDDQVRIDGIYLVSEKKLRELPDDVVLDFNRRGFLQAIHAHLMSLRQANRLATARIEQKGSGSRILGT